MAGGADLPGENAVSLMHPTAYVRLSRAADAALDQLVLDELGAEPWLAAPKALGPSRTPPRTARNSLAVVEPLEGRALMAGDTSTLQTLPFTLEFDAQRTGFVLDKDGEST